MLNDSHIAPSIAGFLRNAEALAAYVDIGQLKARRESVVLIEHDDATEIAVYIDPEAFKALAHGGSSEESLAALLLVGEAVSHFQYIAFRDAFGERVSQLELEVQAEVDKYMLATSFGRRALKGRGVGVVWERDLRRRLFDEVHFLDNENNEEGARYRKANRLAARYLQKFITLNNEERIRERRRFFRMGLKGKIESARR